MIAEKKKLEFIIWEQKRQICPICRRPSNAHGWLYWGEEPPDEAKPDTLETPVGEVFTHPQGEDCKRYEV